MAISGLHCSWHYSHFIRIASRPLSDHASQSRAMAGKEAVESTQSSTSPPTLASRLLDNHQPPSIGKSYIVSLVPCVLVVTTLDLEYLLCSWLPVDWRFNMVFDISIKKTNLLSMRCVYWEYAQPNWHGCLDLAGYLYLPNAFGPWMCHLWGVGVSPTWRSWNEATSDY
jgi:hypothetical protein